MIQAIEAYLAVHRTGGFVLSNDEYLLRSYARFAAERGEEHVRAAIAITWASQSPSLAQRDARLKSVCRFARFVRLEDDAHELPPARHFAHHKVRRLPHIYSDAEIERLINVALALGPPGALRPHTYATLIALLSATGLRVSEALRLRFADLSSEGLVIRMTKFRKSRLVPLHETAALGLERYLRRRRRWDPDHDYVFVTDEGQPLPYGAVHRTFHKLLKAGELRLAPGRPRPRLHDLRHRFAVRALQACPPGRGAVSQHMLALATYLGHANINSTYWYLEATSELLEGIAAAGEAFYQEATS
ncbi:MAG: tyrosine-type recombinase/integrase [Gemmatimonadales bacterium]